MYDPEKIIHQERGFSVPFEKDNKEYKSERPDVSRRNSEIKSKEGHAQNVWLRFNDIETALQFKALLKSRKIDIKTVEAIARIINE